MLLHIEINDAPTLLMVFIVLSFVAGVLIDFITDMLESAVIWCNFIAPPSQYLLNRGKVMGIYLAHYECILDNLCRLAAKNCKQNTDSNKIKEKHEKGILKEVNYIFQVAKNYVFRECKDYQKEQIESFFILYVFCRNITFSLCIVTVLFASVSLFSISILCFLIAIAALMAAYRYFVYYSRALLGSTYNE